MVKIGAPLGGRVHWFLLRLSKTISSEYYLIYDYDYHNYKLYRCSSRFKVLDEFVIVRTSRYCWRCMYVHNQFKYFDYFSCRNSQSLCDKIFDTYIKMRKAELIVRSNTS